MGYIPGTVVPQFRSSASQKCFGQKVLTSVVARIDVFCLNFLSYGLVLAVLIFLSCVLVLALQGTRGSELYAFVLVLQGTRGRPRFGRGCLPGRRRRNTAQHGDGGGEARCAEDAAAYDR